MKKITLLLCGTMLLGMTGCGESSTPQTSAPAGTSAAESSASAAETTTVTSAKTDSKPAADSSAEDSRPASAEHTALKNGAWYIIDRTENRVTHLAVVQDAQMTTYLTLTGTPVELNYSLADGILHLENKQSGAPDDRAVTWISDTEFYAISKDEDAGTETVFEYHWFREADPASFTFTTDNLLTDLARVYYGTRSNHMPQFVDVASASGGERVMLHLYDLTDNHTSTLAWYEIDRFTCKGMDTGTGAAVDLNAKPAEMWNPEVEQRSTLRSSGSFCGIVYLGSVPSSKILYSPDDEFYIGMLNDTGLAEKYPFLTEIPATNFATTLRGTELYLIIPKDNEAQVRVAEYDFVADKETGDVFSSYMGAPFLLKCNYSDIGSDVRIYVTDNSGQHPAFSPYLSGEDGKPRTDSDRVRVLE